MAQAATQAIYRAGSGLVLKGGATAAPIIDMETSGGDLVLSTPDTAPQAFRSLSAATSTRLVADRGSIEIGEAGFLSRLDSVAAQGGDRSVNVSQDAPSSLPVAAPGRVFVQSGVLSVSASGYIAQQNTSVVAGVSSGIVLTNPNHANRVLTIGSGVSAPTSVDLFLSLNNQTGATLSGNQAATSSAIHLNIARTKSYRVNGCVIGEAGVCAVLADAILNLQPADLTSDLLLSAIPRPANEDLTLFGTGNEEMWRRRNPNGDK